jgi:prophage regulatory protein
MTTASESQPAASRLIRLNETMERTGLKRSTLYSLVARGDFPAPVKLSPHPSARAVGFDAGAVERWIRERIEASANKAGK